MIDELIDDNRKNEIKNEQIERRKDLFTVKMDTW